MNRLNDKGITIPELLLSIIMVALLTTIVIDTTFQFWKNFYLINADLDTLVTRLDAGDLIREALVPATGLIIQNSLPDQNPNNVDTTLASPNYWIPNHAIPSTLTMPAAGSTLPVFYFKRYSVNASKNFIMNGTYPYEDEYVLYLNGSTQQLLLRTIANSSASGNAAKSSCPPALATATCPSDKVVANDITSVKARYFSRTGNVIDYTSIYDSTINSYVGPDFPAVEVVELTLNLSQKPTFQSGVAATQNSTVIRIALRNK